MVYRFSIPAITKTQSIHHQFSLKQAQSSRENFLTRLPHKNPDLRREFQMPQLFPSRERTKRARGRPPMLKIESHFVGTFDREVSPLVKLPKGSIKQRPTGERDTENYCCLIFIKIAPNQPLLLATGRR
ncbi:hypothetical protein ACOSQ4_018152 [Xanthoceras sorbifolium]